MKNQKQQIANLTQLNEDLENYFANTIIPQLFVDANLMLRKFTPPAMKQFRLREDHLGRPIEEIKENFRYNTLIDNIKVVIATGKILEKEIQTTDMRWYQMNILPCIVRETNTANGVIITFVDISPRIRDLKEQEKLIAEHELLLDTITHDIKNPILAMGLTLEVLRRKPDQAENKLLKLLENLNSSLKGIKTIVEGLVDARWSSQRYQAAEEILDLQNVLEDVRLAIAPQALQSEATISYDLQITEFTFVRRKLRSLLYNLINNAIKYTPVDRRPEIRISTYKEKEYLVLEVKDNGIGLSKKDQEHIFDKFQRIRPSTEGSGVGLYLVRTIVTATGGKIDIESEPGRGSTFKIFLKPCKKQSTLQTYPALNGQDRL